jgi:2-phosphosulfolactate phosphatase
MSIPVDIKIVAQNANDTMKRDLVMVIDVIRATTSIIAAIANGARSVIPVITIREAKRLHRELSYILAGERKGLKPKGFDLDNSPFSLTVENVAGKNLIMTTTNGTKALVHSKKSKWVMVGAFLNASAVARKSVELAIRNKVGLSFVLAGQDKHFALEDFICAGGIIERLPTDRTMLSDKALGALFAFEGAKNRLQESIGKSKHAQDLQRIGFGRDIEFACQIDRYDVVPFYRNGQIRSSSN